MRGKKKSVGLITAVALAQKSVFNRGSGRRYLKTHCRLSSIIFLTL